MAIYQKVDGVWESADTAYVKVNGVHTMVDDAYVKVGGVWTNAFHYDVTPPPPPELILSTVEKFTRGKVSGNFIAVSARVPGPLHRTDVRRIRVLSSYNNAFPTTQYGGTYTSTADTGWPNEPWSEWRFNGFGSHANTSLITGKQWPVNATLTNKLKDNHTYHFTAWTEDFSGNWSTSVSLALTTPKAGVATANLYHKQARFQVTATGTIDNNDDYTAGALRQSNSPRGNGIWLYGSQIMDAIGQTGTPTIKTAQILVQRYNDSGSASANVYLWWHSYDNPGSLTGPVVKHGMTKIGTIAKGESKWMVIPASHYPYMNGTLRGFGLYYRDPNKAGAFADDYSVMKSIADSPRGGEVVISWTEAF